MSSIFFKSSSSYLNELECGLNIHRIGVTARNSVSIARTSGDPIIQPEHYALIIGPSVAFTASGDTITANGHGLAVGNKFRVIDGLCLRLWLAFALCASAFQQIQGQRVQVRCL